jgi:hypothetical protein
MPKIQIPKRLLSTNVRNIWQEMEDATGLNRVPELDNVYTLVQCPVRV